MFVDADGVEWESWTIPHFKVEPDLMYRPYRSLPITKGNFYQHLAEDTEFEFIPHENTTRN